MKSSGNSPGNIFFGKKPMRKLTVVGLHGKLSLPRQQPRPVIDAMDRFNGKWKYHVGIAKIAWGELSEDELLKSEGHKDKLAELIQQRYAMSAPAANDEVEKLIEKCGF